MVSNTRLTLNLQYPNIAQVAYAMQGDRLSRAVVADLIDGSTPWAPPAGAYGLITASKPDGTFAVYDTLEDESPAIVIDGSTVTLYLAEQVLADAGAVKMSVAFFTAAGARLTTFRWTEVVAPEAVLDRVVSGNYISILTATMAEAAQIFDQIKAAYGAPRVAATAAAMTDHNLIYVYTGSESGYTAGHWYYWDGTAWADGGNYNSTGFTTDTTLTIAGAAADAKATGDEVNDLKSAIEGISDITPVTPRWATSNGYILYTSGGVTSSQNWKRTEFVQIPENAVGLYLTVPIVTDPVPAQYVSAISFYTSNDATTFISDSSVHVIQGNDEGLSERYIEIPPAAKYFRVSCQIGLLSDYYIKASLPLPTQSQITQIKTDFNGVYGDSGEQTFTFTAPRTTLDTGIPVKAGERYRIYISPYSTDNVSDSGINVLVAGGSSSTGRIFPNFAFIDYVPAATGTLLLYNYPQNGYVGDITIRVVSMVGLALSATPVIYRVATVNSFNKSLTSLLYDLKDDTREKIIYIEGGDYDIYSEYRALQAEGKIPAVPESGYNPSTEYVPYNVFVPENTHIIGLGIVRLLWQPTASDITPNESKTWSPINVAGSMTLENVEIVCKNGRYCIHDDPVQNGRYNGSIKHYKNVMCTKEVNDSGLGVSHCFGAGITRNSQYTFDNCTFDNKNGGTARTLYFHDRALVGGVTLQDKMSPIIVANNCTFLSTDPAVNSVFFGNIGAAISVQVWLNSCYINKAIVSADEGDSTAGNNTNSFNIHARFCKYLNLVIRNQAKNYPPTVWTY